MTSNVEPTQTNENVVVFQTLNPVKTPEQGLDTLIEEWRNSFDGLFDDDPNEAVSAHVKPSGIVATYFGQAHQAHGTFWERNHQEVAAELNLYYSRWPKGVV